LYLHIIDISTLMLLIVMFAIIPEKLLITMFHDKTIFSQHVHVLNNNNMKSYANIN
jgi:hypothetical protein